MQFRFVHNNINVFDLEKSINFYKEALGFSVLKEKTAEDGSFKIVYLGDNGLSNHQLELTWIKDKTTPYNLGDNEIHLCVRTDNYEEAFKKHTEMGCVCYINEKMNLYFISDPDGYWTEILREDKK